MIRRPPTPTLFPSPPLSQSAAPARFHIPAAAIRLSARVSAVPPRQGEDPRRIWAPLWPDREVARVPIGHVTNGVHVATWMANRILTLFDSHFGPRSEEHTSELQSRLHLVCRLLLEKKKN